MLLQMSICPKIGLQNVSINSEKWAKLGTLNWTPYQMNNIAMQHPKLVNRLKSQLKTWLQKTEDPFLNYL